MTKLLYKMKMILKIRFVNIMKDAELGSAGDLIRIPPLDMKLGGTRLITPLWTTSTSTCWSLLPPRRLSLPDPPVCQRICWSALIFVGNIGLKGRFVQPKHHQPHPPTFNERKCQHWTGLFKNEVFRIVCVLTRDVKNAECFVCRIDNIFLRACKISNKYFLQFHFTGNPYSRTIFLYTHE